MVPGFRENLMFAFMCYNAARQRNVTGGNVNGKIRIVLTVLFQNSAAGKDTTDIRIDVCLGTGAARLDFARRVNK